MIMDYAWLIPCLPILCFVIVGLLGWKMREGGGFVAILGAAAACVLSILVAYEFISGDYTSYTYDMKWLIIGNFEINFGVYIDGLTCIMMLFSSFISTMIFVYSIGYMDDQGAKKTRYYGEISLFLTGMLGLIVSSNFLQMFIFWEIMGLCSYLLIGFWSYDHPEAKEKSSAAKKAFLVTRAGDVCLMGGLFIMLYLFKSLDYVNIFDMSAIQSVAASEPILLTLAGLLVFGGVIGKSAQFPLHDWLPDAMAGPTTVSALIHAATMVKAGVYLTARAMPLYVFNAEYGQNVLLFIGFIGGFTAIFAASMALNNFNIKKVLAYSTLSQLGYMILALSTRLPRRCLPHAEPRVLQGSPVPLFRIGHPLYRYGGHASHGRTAQEDSGHRLDDALWMYLHRRSPDLQRILVQGYGPRGSHECRIERRDILRRALRTRNRHSVHDSILHVPYVVHDIHRRTRRECKALSP